MLKTRVSQEGVTNALQKVDVLYFAMCCSRDDKILRGNSCNHNIGFEPFLARNGQTWINPGNNQSQKQIRGMHLYVYVPTTGMTRNTAPKLLN